MMSSSSATRRNAFSAAASPCFSSGANRVIVKSVPMAGQLNWQRRNCAAGGVRQAVSNKQRRSAGNVKRETRYVKLKAAPLKKIVESPFASLEKPLAPPHFQAG